MAQITSQFRRGRPTPLGRAVLPRPALYTPSPGLAFGGPDDRLLRGIPYAAASRFYHRRLWNTGSPGQAERRRSDTHPHSRGARRPGRAGIIGPKKEGAGNAGRPPRPQPRVQNKKAHEHSHHGHTGITRHSPHNGLAAYIALSPATGLSCRRRPQVATCKLDASVGASGPHDFAVRASAARLATPSRPPHPAPTFVTTRTPLSTRRDGASRKFDLPDGESEIFLQRGLDSDFANAARRANQSGESIPTPFLLSQGRHREVTLRLEASIWQRRRAASA